MSLFGCNTELVRVSRADTTQRIVLVELDDPEKNNVISIQLLDELSTVLTRADNNAQTEGIILGSTSEDVFCAGANLSELMSFTVEEGNRFLDEYLSIIEFLWKTGKPVIAVVPGDCVAGGNELAIACDLIIAEESARFGQPEATVGSTAAGGGVQLLPLLIGIQRTKDLLYTGRLINADTAKQWGLINRVVPDGNGREKGVSILTDILDEKSPQAFRSIKAILRHWQSLGMNNQSVARELTANVWASDEFNERAEAFLKNTELPARRFSGTTTDEEIPE